MMMMMMIWGALFYTYNAALAGIKGHSSLHLNIFLCSLHQEHTHTSGVFIVLLTKVVFICACK